MPPFLAAQAYPSSFVYDPKSSGGNDERESVKVWERAARELRLVRHLFRPVRMQP